uniref:Tetraspanin n=1 Tax=Rhabditophanes sp. KR3021 TaxID=114890 RepID=A0AC35TTV2_9BILA
MGSDSSCCNCCSRVFMIILNILMLLVGLAIIGLTLWVRLDDNFEYGIRGNILNISSAQNTQEMINNKREMTNAITIVFWVLIGYGVVDFVLALIGFIGAGTKNSCCLWFNNIILLLFIALEIAVIVYVVVNRDTYEEVSKRYARLSVQTNSNDYNVIRTRYNCCGSDQSYVGCNQGIKTCTDAVWERLNITIIIGLIVIGIQVIGQSILTMFSCISACTGGYSTLNNAPA